MRTTVVILPALSASFLATITLRSLVSLERARAAEAWWKAMSACRSPTFSLFVTCCCSHLFSGYSDCTYRPARATQKWPTAASAPTRMYTLLYNFHKAQKRRFPVHRGWLYCQDRLCPTEYINAIGRRRMFTSAADALDDFDGKKCGVIESLCDNSFILNLCDYSFDQEDKYFCLNAYSSMCREVCT